ncbi:MAG: class B sortase [Oscillospiraceae bacterium]|nr:class B sortase [Oscillospiraceae bacterium]
MSDENKELRSLGGGSDEALSRAERIKAIKYSIRKQSGQTAEPADVPEIKPAEDVQSEVQPKSEADAWESELAERIAKRVNKVKTDKKSVSAAKTPESMLAELNSIIASNSGKEEITGNTPSDAEINAVIKKEKAEAPSEDECPAAEKINQTQEIPEAEVISDSGSEKKVRKKSGKKKKTGKKKKSFKESLRDLFPRKKDSLGERIRKIVFLGSVCAFIVFAVIIADYYIGIYTVEHDYDELMKNYNKPYTVPETNIQEVYDGEFYSLLPNAKNLLDKNSDTVGVINIPGTEVYYPVVQSDDLEKYLDMSFTGEKAKAGSIFLDYRNSFDKVDEKGHLIQPNSDNLIIYGHNMGSGMMFGSLKNYKNNANYYGEHPIIELNSNYKCYKYKIFAFFIIDAEDTTDTAFECWNQLNFSDETEFYDFVNEAKRRTIRLNNVDVQYGDKLLTLSTCNSIFGNGGSGRLMVMARLVRDGEDPMEGTQDSIPNPNIKWPTLYYKYNKDAKYDPSAEFVPYGTTEAQETTDNSEE